MYFFDKYKRIIATILIVTSVMTNNGFFTFANSIGEVVAEESRKGSKEPKNYYIEYLQETYEIEYEQTVTYPESGEESSEEVEEESVQVETENKQEEIKEETDYILDGEELEEVEDEEETEEQEEPEDPNDYEDESEDEVESDRRNN